jgi:hypothetical protein
VSATSRAVYSDPDDTHTHTHTVNSYLSCVSRYYHEPAARLHVPHVPASDLLRSDRCLQVLLPEVPDFVFGSTSGRLALRLKELPGRSVCSNPRVRCFGSGLNMVLVFRSSTSTAVSQLPVSTAGWFGLSVCQGQMQGSKSGRCGCHHVIC